MLDNRPHGRMGRDMTDEMKTLFDFLEVPLDDSTSVLERFSGLPGAISSGTGQDRSVYVPGSREDRAVLVAHADTYWPDGPARSSITDLVTDGHTVRSTDPSKGIGADDRAGCAILWLLRDSGHSLLVLDGEEGGRIGANWLMRNRPEIARELNGSHRFMLEFDRRNSRDLKRYYVGTDRFLAYVEKSMPGFRRAMHAPGSEDRSSFTDICTLCSDVCGINVSVGYRNEHTPAECLVLGDWLNTLETARRWLCDSGELPRYPLALND